MHKIISTVILSMLMTASSFAADGSKTAQDPKMQEMMKKMKEFATPGPSHKILADMAGNWTYTSKWWESSAATPQESKGTSKMKMILGGRWLQHDTKGQAMGMPFEGMGLTGYDNNKGKFETLWFDTMGTGVTHGQGTFDASTNTLKDSGQYSCPMSSDKVREYRGEWKIVDKNNMVYTMFGPGMDDSKEFKQMEMTFKRTK